MEKYKDKDWLTEQYHNKEKYQYEIAQEVGVVQSTIGTWMDKHGIKTRVGGPAGNEFKADEEIIGFVEGSLLGDGSLQCRSNQGARYTLSQKYKEYPQWISQYLSKFGIDQSGKITDRLRGSFGSDPTWLYTFKTLDYINFKKYYDKWYPNGEKIIPENLNLTPKGLRHWLIEDGGLYENNWGTQEVRFATNGFRKSNVDRLTNNLADIIGVSSDYIHVSEHNGPYIHFGKPGVVAKFYNYIAPLPERLEPIYGYKWPS